MEKVKEKSSFFRKFVGDKRFYLMVLSIAVPIMVQNGITNFVSLLDNIMIGRIGTEQMSGAAIVNQLIFVYNLCIFGGVSGAGIFTAQYFGQKDHEGVRQTLRYKLWMAVILLIEHYAPCFHEKQRNARTLAKTAVCRFCLKITWTPAARPSA